MSQSSPLRSALTALLANDAVVFGLFGFAALLTYWQTLGLYWVQDDAYAFMAGRHWLSQFGRYTDLQYRPLAFGLGWVLEGLFGVSPITLRIGSFAIHTLNCLLLFRFISRVMGNRLHAFLATLVFAMHYALYFVFGLYLVAAMPGLGVTTFLLTMACFQNALAARGRETRKAKPWLILGLAWQIAGLLLYEGSITVVACLVPLVWLQLDPALWRERQWKKLCAQFLPVVPYLGVTLVYLLVRIPLIRSALGEERYRSSSYHPDLAKIVDNFVLAAKTTLGWPRYFSFNEPKFYFFCGVAAVALLFLAKRNPRVFFLGGTIWLVGTLPFLSLTAFQEYYVIFSLLGGCLLLAAFFQALEWGPITRFLGLLAMAVFLGFFAFRSITVVNRNYSNHSLTLMGDWAMSFNQQFFALARRYPPGAEIEVRGISEWQQWRIHFGRNTNIHYPENVPYRFTFVTREGARTRAGQADQIDRVAGTGGNDGGIVLQLVNLDPDEVKGQFRLVEVAGPWTKAGQ